MTDYNAPLTDIRFLLNEVAGLPAIARLPGCEEATPDWSMPCWRKPANSPPACWRR
jgi:hypothetical protein